MDLKSSLLKNLQSDLESCLNAKVNLALKKEKEANQCFKKRQNGAYINLMEDLFEEEANNVNISKELDVVKQKEVCQGLKEQMLEKKLLAAMTSAEDAVSKLSNQSDTHSILIAKPKDKYSMEKEQKLLKVQMRMKEINVEKEEVHDELLQLDAENYNIRNNILKELERQKCELRELHRRQLELSEVERLEVEMKANEDIISMRQEMQVLEKHRNEEQQHKLKQLNRQRQQNVVKEERERQARNKLQNECKEELQEAKYRNILLELQYEEGRLCELRDVERRRRQREHYAICIQIMEERKKCAIATASLEEKKNSLATQQNELTEAILLEKEKELVLRFAPHLGPYLTPKICSMLVNS